MIPHIHSDTYTDTHAQIYNLKGNVDLCISWEKLNNYEFKLFFSIHQSSERQLKN